jgi:uncharacterized membrane protein YbhN (UPF0104 family)
MTQKTSPRSKLWTFVKAILALALIGFTLSQTDLNELLTLREHISWNWLWLYALLYFALTLLKTYQYKKLLNLPIPYARMVGIVVMQNGLSNLVANSAGIASYLVMLRGEEGVKTSRAALAFVITKIGDLFAIWTALLISSLLLWEQISVLHNTVIVLLITIGTPLFGFLLIIFLRERLTTFLRRILEKTKLIRVSIIAQGMDGLEALVHEKRDAIFKTTITAFSLSAIYFLVTLAWYVAQLRLFSVAIGFLSIIFVSAILQLISIIPITILGGLGVIETSSLYLYTLVGVEPISFAAVLIGLRALFYIINLVILLYMPIYSFFEARRA